MYLETLFLPREILFRAIPVWLNRIKIGNEIASASAFPSATWERGKNAPHHQQATVK
jgi:hypothetical protein